jgi:cation diffusion facilitator family transporter
MASESKGTILVALAANALIAVAKAVGGLLSGSSAMLAEAAHSVADTLNQVFLLTSLRMSSRPADPEHPFGYGKSTFFWAFLAAVGIFVAGAVFSLFEGIHAILGGGEQQGGILVPYLVLGVALVAEGTSWLRALTQLRGEARAAGRGVLEHVRRSKDPTVKTVLWEDSVAVTGVLLAAAGIGLHRITGQAWWDGVAAVLVGLLLAVVAVLLGHQNQELLLGQAADPELVVGIHDQIAEAPEVAHVVELLTMHLGPDSILVAARLDLGDGFSAEQVEAFSSRIDEELVQRWPQVRQVFLDPTRPDPELASRTRRYITRLGEKTGVHRGEGDRVSHPDHSS